MNIHPNENRASQIETMLKHLPQTAEQGLSALKATPEMKARIQLAACQAKAAPCRPSLNTAIRWASLACCAALVVLALVIALPHHDEALQPASLISSGTLGNQATAEPPISGDLGGSGVVIRSGNRNPGYRSMWADVSGGSFPLIGVNGKYYRLLTTPRNVDSALRGSAVGTIDEFTTNPSLSSTNTVLSNVVAPGETVYAIRGMGDTLVTARVDGQMRLFQRVSFNGNALRGRERLEDTLQIAGRVIGIELTGVGTITDPDICNRLVEVLFDCASYESSGSVSSRQSLILELDNGLVVQMAVKNDSVAACGVWSCPEFFEEFEAMCN
ncbi:MAG: hypothetical protein IKK57_03055 [Clostridia bacterium]|nr:hypothetical protein [Clostridia bacterium]